MSDVANEVSKTTSDLADFHQFIGDLLKSRDRDLTPEEALRLWRTEDPQSEDFEETVEALREALADMKAGDVGIPLEEFDAEFSARHNLPPRNEVSCSRPRSR
jgi:hypothetical protein